MTARARTYDTTQLTRKTPSASPPTLHRFSLFSRPRIKSQKKKAEAYRPGDKREKEGQKVEEEEEEECRCGELREEERLESSPGTM